MPERGEVWQVDLGVTQKVRPALVIRIPYAETGRALFGVTPHTTAPRGSQFEISASTPFLGEGAFLVQGILSLPPKDFLRRLGVLTPAQPRPIEAAPSASARPSGPLQSIKPRRLARRGRKDHPKAARHDICVHQRGPAR